MHGGCPARGARHRNQTRKDGALSTSSQFAAPRTLDEATALLARRGSAARVVAGATDLMVQVRIAGTYPDHYVDIKQIPEVNVIDLQADHLQLGAAVSCAALSERPDVRAAFPGLVEAAELIGSTQIQSRATLGGNLCNASPAADTVPALMALGAQAVIAGPGGTRTVPVTDVPAGPGATTLADGEIVVAFRIPAPPVRSADAYQRFIPRTEMDIAVVGVGVSVTLDAAGSCTAARVALGAVAPTAFVAEEAGAALVGTDLGEAALAEAGRRAAAAARPISDRRGTAGFRRDVTAVLTRRTAAAARDRAAART